MKHNNPLAAHEFRSNYHNYFTHFSRSLGRTVSLSTLASPSQPSFSATLPLLQRNVDHTIMWLLVPSPLISLKFSDATAAGACKMHHHNFPLLLSPLVVFKLWTSQIHSSTRRRHQCTNNCTLLSMCTGMEEELGAAAAGCSSGMPQSLSAWILSHTLVALYQLHHPHPVTKANNSLSQSLHFFVVYSVGS